MMLFIDYETYYADDYHLKRGTSGLIRTEYINDPRFKVHGAAIAIDDSGDQWITAKHLPEFFGDMGPHITGMCCHNGLFDHGITAKYYLQREVMLFDTMSMAQGALSTRFPRLSVSLDALGRHYFPDQAHMHKTLGVLENFKNVRDLSPEQEKRMGEYAMQDNLVMRALFKALLQEEYPWATALEDIHLTLAMGVYPVLCMDNIMAGKIHAAEVRAKVEAAKALGITREMLRSANTFANMLRACGVEPPTKISPKTGEVAYAFAAKDEDFKALADHEDVRVRALYETRVGEKASQNESRAALFARLPAELPIPLRYAAAHTGRHGGDEYNMQNLGRKSELRRTVKARKGHKILVRDLAQIELRTNAWWCGEEWLLDLLRAGGDPYCMLATKIYGREITKADEAERFVGKQGELSCGYQSGDAKILMSLKQQGVKTATPELAKAVKNGYRSTHPAIVKMWDHLQRIAMPVVAGFGEPYEHKGVRFEHSRVVLPSGRSLWYPELHVNEDGDWVFRVNKKRNKGQEWKKLFGGSFLENIIQALSYDIFMAHARRAWKAGRRIAMAVHDEMNFSVPEEEVEEVNELIAKIQCTTTPWCAGIPLKGEGGWADNYLEAK